MDNLNELSNTYTWEVTSKSNGDMSALKIVAPLGKPARLIVPGGPFSEDALLARLSEPALESLAMALSHWLEWRKQREAANAAPPDAHKETLE